jgi:hypothetical protein
MLEGFCSNCKKKSYFTHIKDNKYKCNSCGAELKKCKNKKGNCLNMINIKKPLGYCDDCINKGIKVGRVGPIAALGGLGALAWKNKDKIIKVAFKVIKRG